MELWRLINVHSVVLHLRDSFIVWLQVLEVNNLPDFVEGFWHVVRQHGCVSAKLLSEGPKRVRFTTCITC